MTTLVEDVAKQYEAYRISVLTHIEEYKPEYTLEWARDVLRLIDSHPETLERRRKDFEAGRDSVGLDHHICYEFEDHIDTEKR